MDNPILGIDHIGIAVGNFAEACKTYEDILGFQISGYETLEDRGLEVCFVNAGSSALELLGATRQDSEISKFLEKRGDGVHHICLRVQDLKAQVDAMQQRGARIVGDGIQKGAGGTEVAFIHPKSSNGVLIELVQDRPGEQHNEEKRHG